MRNAHRGAGFQPVIVTMPTRRRQVTNLPYDQRRLLSAAMALSVGITVSISVIGRADSAPEGRSTLRYQFRPGQTLHYIVEDTSQDSFTRGEVTSDVEYSTTTWKHFEVVSVDSDGSAVLELQLDRVVMKAQESGADPIAYDSDNEAPPPAQFVGIRKTIGQPMARVKVSPTGEASQMQWLLDGVPNPGLSSLSDLNLPTPLPEGPVAIGEKWKEPFEVEVTVDLVGGLKKTIKLQRQYRLDSVADGQATISLETAVLTPLNDPAQRAQVIKKLAKGTAVFDLDQGWLVSRKTKVDETVIGFNGSGSRLHNVASRVESIGQRR